MQQIKNSEELKRAILELEKKRKIQETVIKEQFQLTKEAAKPANLIRNTFSKLAAVPEVRRTVVNTLMGIAIGYFSKKAQQVLSEKSMNDLMRNLVDTTADHLTQTHPDSLLSKGVNLTRTYIKHEALSNY
jgi:hypothetical protein